MAVLALPFLGVTPLIVLGRETTARIWALTAVAAVLGVVLWLWVRSEVVHTAKMRNWRPSRAIVIASGVVASVLVAGAPGGVRMIYCGAVEGFVLAAAFAVGRILYREQRLKRRFSSRDDGDGP